MIISLLIALISIAYFIGMVSISACYDTFIYYDAIFVSLITWAALTTALYFSKMVFCGDCCCKCLYMTSIVLSLIAIVIVIILNHGIINAYGIGFSNPCQTLTTLYIFGGSTIILFILVLVILIMCLSPAAPSYDDI